LNQGEITTDPKDPYPGSLWLVIFVHPLPTGVKTHQLRDEAPPEHLSIPPPRFQIPRNIPASGPPGENEPRVRRGNAYTSDDTTV